MTWRKTSVARLTTMNDGARDPAESIDALDDEDAQFALGSLDFSGLDTTQFEDFCFDLITASGFSNVDWRKGTPLSSSPADRGRDIVAHSSLSDIDGHGYEQTWFIDCKHYARGVPPEALQGTIAWANAERPDVVLFIASGYLTNGAKDWISDFQRTSIPPYRIRVWEKPQLLRLVEPNLDVAFRHDVGTSTLRRVSEVSQAEATLFDQLWWGRKPADDALESIDWPEDFKAGTIAAKRRVEAQHGLDELEKNVESDWAWGYLSGRISAIRWVLGDEWHNLDS